MIELDRPLKTRLREPSRPPADAIWQRIQARRNRPPRPWHALRLRACHSAFVLVPALCLAGAWLVQRGYLSSRPAALRWSDGRALELVRTGAQAQTLTLSDGSRLEVGPDAQLAPRNLDDHLFATELVRGRVTFDIVPHGPRRWTISAGDVQVSVLGTRFAVERGAQGVAVHVQRGLVEVTGPGVPNGTRRLGAGEGLFVAPQSRAATAARGPSAAVSAEAPALPSAAAGAPKRAPAADGGGSSTTPSAAAGAARPAPAADGGRAATIPSAAVGAPKRAPAADGGAAAARANRTDRGGQDIETLLAKADAARRAADPRAAARAFRRIVEQFPDDSRTALAAFTLAQLYLDQLRRPDLAARALIEADTLGLPRALAEEAAARLVESYFRSGQAARAREAGLDYLVRFPAGARRRQVEAWSRQR